MVIDLTIHHQEDRRVPGLLGTRSCRQRSIGVFNVPQGMAVGALPSGRVPSAHCAGCSLPGRGPAPGRPPYSFARQAPHLHRRRHALNLKFTPASVEGEAGRIRLSAFLKSFLDLTCSMSSSTWWTRSLRCAQAHPEEYKSLLVR